MKKDRKWYEFWKKKPIIDLENSLPNEFDFEINLTEELKNWIPEKPLRIILNRIQTPSVMYSSPFSSV